MLCDILRNDTIKEKYFLWLKNARDEFARYILLEWQRRKANDPKTICELFYVCCDDIQDIEICTALSSLIAIFREGIGTVAIKIAYAVKTQLINRFLSQLAFIKVLFPEPV